MNKSPYKIQPFSDLILFEDDQYIVINKPPYLSTLEDRNSPVNLLKLARAYHPDASVCHRLDKETSGLLVISKNETAYKYFAHLLQEREVVKVYHALVEGRREIHELELNKPIYSSSSRSRIDFKQGKQSLTLVTTVEIYKQHTLVACMPFTGRMHQIRVHLADAGMPIIGDEEYGGKPLLLSQIKRKYSHGKFEEEKPMIGRVALHAAGLSFTDMSNKTQKLSAPYPRDLQAAITQLEKNKS